MQVTEITAVASLNQQLTLASTFEFYSVSGFVSHWTSVSVRVRSFSIECCIELGQQMLAGVMQLSQRITIQEKVRGV